MIVAHRPEELEPARRAVALGTFDGVHRGHRRVIEAAEAAHLRSAVVTFDPHPRAVLGGPVELLTTLERRLELLEAAGVEDVLVVRFDVALLELTPEAFAETVLRAIGTEVVAAGDGFRFGHGRSGDLDLLARLGFDVRRVPLVDNVSSSHIRALLKAGDVAHAAQLLGRPAEVEGTVVTGDQRGEGLGFPTANLAVPTNLLVPGLGIYAGSATRAPRGGLDRHESALRRHRTAGRGFPARFCGRPLRPAPRRRAVAEASGRGCLRLRGGARGGDRDGRRPYPRRRAPRLKIPLPLNRASSGGEERLVGVEHSGPGPRSLIVFESVRCLECGEAYSKPTAGGTVQKNPGCPACGYVGWIALTLPGERGSRHPDAGQRPRRFVQVH